MNDDENDFDDDDNDEDDHDNGVANVIERLT